MGRITLDDNSTLPSTTYIHTTDQPTDISVLDDPSLVLVGENGGAATNDKDHSNTRKSKTTKMTTATTTPKKTKTKKVISTKGSTDSDTGTGAHAKSSSINSNRTRRSNRSSRSSSQKDVVASRGSVSQTKSGERQQQQQSVSTNNTGTSQESNEKKKTSSSFNVSGAIMLVGMTLLLIVGPFVIMSGSSFGQPSPPQVDIPNDMTEQTELRKNHHHHHHHHDEEEVNLHLEDAKTIPEVADDPPPPQEDDDGDDDELPASPPEDEEKSHQDMSDHLDALQDLLETAVGDMPVLSATLSWGVQTLRTLTGVTTTTTTTTTTTPEQTPLQEQQPSSQQQSKSANNTSTPPVVQQGRPVVRNEAPAKNKSGIVSMKTDIIRNEPCEACTFPNSILGYLFSKLHWFLAIAMIYFLRRSSRTKANEPVVSGTEHTTDSSKKLALHIAKVQTSLDEGLDELIKLKHCIHHDLPDVDGLDVGVSLEEMQTKAETQQRELTQLITFLSTALNFESFDQIFFWSGSMSTVFSGKTSQSPKPKKDKVHTSLLDCPVMTAGRVYEWKILVEDKDYLVHLGVASNVHFLDEKKWLGRQAGGWSYRSDGSSWHNFLKVHDGLPTLDSGDMVHFKLDLLSGHGTLSVRVDKNGFSPKKATPVKSRSSHNRNGNDEDDDQYMLLCRDLLSSLEGQDAANSGFRPAVSARPGSRIRFLGFTHTTAGIVFDNDDHLSESQPDIPLSRNRFFSKKVSN